MSVTIGSIEPARILSEARRWRADEVAALGAAARPTDLPPWTHPQLQSAAAARAHDAGGLVVCSGGTTGAPKLTVLAPDLGVPRVLAAWRPLGPGDVLLNLFPTGKMWGAQYFYNALAVQCRSAVAPIGALRPEEFGEWADVIVGLGITALAGSPNVLARFADMVRDAGVRLPVRAVLWSGEPMTRPRVDAIRSAFPRAGLWGNYGSIETFVIGVSYPECRLGALHLLPDQCLEPDDGGALLTRVGDGWPSPALRFRLGDRIRHIECPCGVGDAFEVLGRADDNVKLYGGMVRVGDVLAHAAAVPGVDEAQVVLYRDPDVPSAIVGMRLCYAGPNPDPDGVRERIVRALEDLDILDRHTPEAFVVSRVTDVERNPKTQKVVPLLWRSARNLAEMADPELAEVAR